MHKATGASPILILLFILLSSQAIFAVIVTHVASEGKTTAAASIGIPNLLDEEAAKYEVIIQQTGSSEDFLPHVRVLEFCMNCVRLFTF